MDKAAVEESHLHEINTWLALLTGGSDNVTGYEILQGGISGSTVYRLVGGAEPRILKLTLPSAPEYVRVRAAREAVFYRTPALAIPLALPRVLGLDVGDAGGSALLLAAYRPPDPPAAWDASRYLAVAAQLARLHAAFWDKTERLAALPWLRRPPAAADPARIRYAQVAWQALQSRPAFAAILTPPVAARIARLLDHVPALSATMQTLPATLCHGDCHTGNLLYDAEGCLIWADWQEVGIGCGPEDLAFFVQRALIARGAVPEDPMIERYCAELAAHRPAHRAGGDSSRPCRFRIAHAPAGLAGLSGRRLGGADGGHDPAHGPAGRPVGVNRFGPGLTHKSCRKAEHPRRSSGGAHHMRSATAGSTCQPRPRLTSIY